MPSIACLLILFFVFQRELKSVKEVWTSRIQTMMKMKVCTKLHFNAFSLLKENNLMVTHFIEIAFGFYCDLLIQCNYYHAEFIKAVVHALYWLHVPHVASELISLFGSRPCQDLRPLPPGPAGHPQIRPVVSPLSVWPQASLNDPRLLLISTLWVLRRLLLSPQHESLPGAHFKWEVPVRAEVLQNLGEWDVNNPQTSFLTAILRSHCLVNGSIRNVFWPLSIVITINNYHNNWFHEYIFLHFTVLMIVLQECYVHNLLKVTVYIPTIQRDVLEIVIGKMLKIDVSVGSVLWVCIYR